MRYNPEIHHRKSIRLKYYDYSKEGMYFITICTQNRKHILGKIITENELKTYVGADDPVRPQKQNNINSIIVQGFKSVTTRKCFEYNYEIIWQRNYYEHVIRDEKEYYKIKEYIQNNVIKWEEDKYFEH